MFADWTPYHYVHNNPLRYTDPDGRSADDIHLNAAGKVIGDDGVGNGVRISQMTTSKQFNNEFAKGGVDRVRSLSSVVSVESEASVTATTNKIESTTVATETKGYIVLDTNNKTLSLEIQPTSPRDRRYASLNEYDDVKMTTPDGKVGYKAVKGSNGTKVIMGQAHGHPGTSGLSGNDVSSSANLGVNVYAIDSKAIHKVTPTGVKTANMAKNTNIVKDSLNK